MRDLAVIFIVFVSLPFVFRRPWLGILMWSWLGYMNPHRLAWGFAYTFPFSQVVAVVTLLGFLFMREPRRFELSTVTVTWILFVLWMTVTTFLALDTEGNWQYWAQVNKIQLFALLTVLLIHGRERILSLVWVIVLSLGFFGLKGGLFVFRTGGEARVYGPPGSFIEENNALALALIMIIPLFWFLYIEYQNRWLRFFLATMMVTSCAAVLGSHSRGAALAGAGMLCFLWLKGTHKGRLGFAMVLVLPILILAMPPKYFERVESISSYQEDGSAKGRIRAWGVATQIALQRPIVGGGFNSMVEANYRRFAPDVAREVEEKKLGWSEAHSIYFKVLADHGFVGLALFLMLGVATYRSAGKALRESRDLPNMEWVGRLAAMLQVGIVGYAVGGAFLGLCYFDLYYALIAIVIGVRITLRDARLTERVPDRAFPDGALTLTRNAS